jgi:hypothetical protein
MRHIASLAPGIVFGAIASFLAGAWPDTAFKVHALDPSSGVSF